MCLEAYLRTTVVWVFFLCSNHPLQMVDIFSLFVWIFFFPLFSSCLEYDLFMQRFLASCHGAAEEPSCGLKFWKCYILAAVIAVVVGNSHEGATVKAFPKVRDYHDSAQVLKNPTIQVTTD